MALHLLELYVRLLFAVVVIGIPTNLKEVNWDVCLCVSLLCSWL